MKKPILLTIVGIFIVVNAFSSNMNVNTISKPDSLLIYQFMSETDSVLVSKSYFTYDSEKNITTEIIHEKSSSDQKWYPIQKYENLTSVSDTYYASYAWDKQLNLWICHFKYERRFDPEGRELLYKSYELKNGSGNGNMYEFKYDKDGNRKTEEYSVWNVEKKSWNKSRKVEYEYNAEGKVILKIESEWNYNLNDWMVFTKEKTEYQIQDDVEYSFSDVWSNVNQTWDKHTKGLCKYNDTGLVTYKSISVWNKSSNAYVLSSRNEYSYDERDNLILEVNYGWDNSVSDWVPTNKYEHLFDSNGNETLNAWYRWSIETNNWVGNNKSEEVFNSDGQTILNISYDWSGILNNWIKNEKREWSYNSDGQTILFIYSDWDETLNDWLPVSKNEWDYDNFQNQLLNASYSWDKESQQWKLSQKGKSEYVYNQSGEVSIFLVYFWDMNSLSCKLRYKYYYYYNDSTNSVFYGYPADFGVKVFPNPTKGFINITGADNAQLFMYDQSGKCCYSSGIDNKSINMSDFPNGIYLLKIKTDKGFYTSKIVKGQ